MFDPGKRYFVRKRLERRMSETGLGSFRSYFSLVRLQQSQEEFQALVNEMTVNETYFLREDYQFRCLAEGILPEISRQRPGQAIKIWSVPCSTERSRSRSCCG